MTVTETIEDITFCMEQPVETIHGTTADERWTYKDRAGHAHAYVEGDGDHYPTLVQECEHVPCPDPEGCGCDGYEDCWLQCRECGERIRPGQRPAVFYRTFRPATYSISGVPVPEGEFLRRRDEMLGRLSK
jgi:hypothetical protein